jgi:hypothetical protein
MWVFPGTAISLRRGTATDPRTIITESCSLSREPGAVHDDAVGQVVSERLGNKRAVREQVGAALEQRERRRRREPHRVIRADEHGRLGLVLAVAGTGGNSTTSGAAFSCCWCCCPSCTRMVST